MAGMDRANLVAAWLSAFATAIGLGSLTTQSVAIRDQLDPFHEARRGDYMGVWAAIQPPSRWYTFTKPAPIGPVISANLDGCLGQTTVYLSRSPMYATGKPSWTVLLAVFHPLPIKATAVGESEKSFVITIDESAIPSSSPSASFQSGPVTPVRWWHEHLQTRPLIYHHAVACNVMSRPTLITFMLLSQARQIYRYSDAAGLRMAYQGYNGTYQIEWPIGERPIVSFSSAYMGKDSHPETFPRRPRKCIEMGIGIIDLTEGHAEAAFAGRKIAFAGRKAPGRWVLERLPNRYSAQRTAADLYNAMGGEAYEVDFLFRRRLESHEPEPPHELKLHVPSLKEGEDSILYLAREEALLITTCLDNLPWSPLAWSIHRGMKDILVAYGRQTMRAYRDVLAEAFHKAVAEKGETLVAQRWPPKFVAESMANQAASAIRGGEECSGDACRIVSAVALLVGDKPKDDALLDRTTFWRSNLVHTPTKDQGIDKSELISGELTSDTVIALVKLFLVQWSHEFDYGMYFDLPIEFTVV